MQKEPKNLKEIDPKVFEEKVERIWKSILKSGYFPCPTINESVEWVINKAKEYAKRPKKPKRGIRTLHQGFH